MKTFKEYLPESFLTELGAGPNDSISPVSGAESSGYPDPAESKFGNRELNVGDPVIITGNVEFSGKTGDVAAFGRDNHFVIVNLYNHGKHSFHASNVAYNDYNDFERTEHVDESKFGNRELNVGDPVIITGNVEFSGKTGDVAAFGRDNHFVIVNLYNHGKHSFHASNVAYNDYADEEHEGDDDADEDDRALYDLRKLSGY